MRKSKDLGEEVRNQQKKRNANEDNNDYSARGISGRGALSRMEPKFNKKVSGNASSISTHLVAFRNLGNERFLKGDYAESI
jgi:hypothetical protein